ncbi:hypothetical protein PAMA_008892 [Pampus argenteus]
MAHSGRDRDLPAAERSGSGRTQAEPRTGEQPEQLVYLTCLPERYRAAKFSLAAYLLCWALLRWDKQSHVLNLPAGFTLLSGYRGVLAHIQPDGSTSTLLDSKVQLMDVCRHAACSLFFTDISDKVFV